MSVDVTESILIERRRDNVAAIMFDPKCDTVWIGGLTNVFPLSPGMLQKGSRVERVGEFLSKHFATTLLVTNCEPENSAELAIDEPFPMRVRYRLDDADEGTRTSIRVQSTGEIDLKLPPTLLNESVAKKVANDLARLKKHVETVYDADGAAR